ncbi:hypothetical protein PG985_016014 [Apiospora marii]|uniref:uncharacterized protein n=1 Tax=Apiospora marii TaxID=335849 RepID=UPI00312D1A36
MALWKRTINALTYGSVVCSQRGGGALMSCGYGTAPFISVVRASRLQVACQVPLNNVPSGFLNAPSCLHCITGHPRRRRERPHSLMSRVAFSTHRYRNIHYVVTLHETNEQPRSTRKSAVVLTLSKTVAKAPNAMYIGRQEALASQLERSKTVQKGGVVAHQRGATAAWPLYRPTRTKADWLDWSP